MGQILYLEEAACDYRGAATAVVEHIHKHTTSGIILVYMPGEEDVEMMCASLRRTTQGMNIRPLYSNLPEKEKERVLNRVGVDWLCVVATNIHIEHDNCITHVVDAGLAKYVVWNPRLRCTMLQTTPISQCTADIRARKAGNTCYRLYTKAVYEGVMLPHEYPPHLRKGSRNAILASKAGYSYDDMTRVRNKHQDCCATNKNSYGWDLGYNPENFLRAFEELTDLGLLDMNAQITTEGRVAYHSGLDVIWLPVLREAKPLGCSQALLVLVCFACTRGSVFARPHLKKHVADLAKAQFAHPLSDHLSQLNVWWAFQQVRTEDEAQWCFDHFISEKKLSEVRDMVRLVKNRLSNEPHGFWPQQEDHAASHNEYMTNIRRALARGLFHQTAIHKSGTAMTPIFGRRNLNRHGSYDDRLDHYETVYVDPNAIISGDSALVGSGHGWVVYNSFMLAARPYLNVVTAIEPEWLVDLPFFDDNQKYPKYSDTVKAALERVRSKMAERAAPDSAATATAQNDQLAQSD